MQKGVLVAVLMLGLLPVLPSFAQLTDKEPTLGIILTSFTPYHYTNKDGHTVIIGEVQNTKDFPITGVKIWAGFYNESNLSPLESTTGTSLLDVIPPNSKVPYVIVSPSPNPEITNVSVNLLGFNSAGPKSEQLELDEGAPITFEDELTYSGTITNGAGVAAQNVQVHLVLYDGFEPPRLIRAETITLDEPIMPGASAEFSFEAEYTAQTAGIRVFAESSGFLSNVVDTGIAGPAQITKKILINGVSLVDSDGDKLADIQTGAPVVIQGSIWLQISPDESYDQDYVYYAQVKQSGSQALVEYIGAFDGRFDTPETQTPQVEWIPENSGVYFVETFVWDSNGVPLGSKGPVALMLVN